MCCFKWYVNLFNCRLNLRRIEVYFIVKEKKFECLVIYCKVLKIIVIFVILDLIGFFYFYFLRVIIFGFVDWNVRFDCYCLKVIILGFLYFGIYDSKVRVIILV